jgi:hypothetical protein
MANEIVLLVPTLATVAENAVLPSAPSPHPPFHTRSITFESTADSQVPEEARFVWVDPIDSVGSTVAGEEFIGYTYNSSRVPIHVVFPMTNRVDSAFIGVKIFTN